MVLLCGRGFESLQLHGKEYFQNTPFLLQISELGFVLVHVATKFGITK